MAAWGFSVIGPYCRLIELRGLAQKAVWWNGQNPRMPGKKMVGETGFEPATLCSQSRCATRLRYSPTRVPR